MPRVGGEAHARELPPPPPAARGTPHIPTPKSRPSAEPAALLTSGDGRVMTLIGHFGAVSAVAEGLTTRAMLRCDRCRQEGIDVLWLAAEGCWW